MGGINNNNASPKIVHERILQKLLGLKFVGLVIAVGIIVISVSKFVDSVSSLVSALPTQEETISAFDTKTQEQTLYVAKEIDNLCSTIIESETTSYEHFAETYRSIDVELQNLLLRQQSRPLNEVSVRTQQIIIKEFIRLREYHMSIGEFGRVFVEEVRKSFHLKFKIILSLEASKPSGKT